MYMMVPVPVVDVVVDVVVVVVERTTLYTPESAEEEGKKFQFPVLYDALLTTSRCPSGERTRKIDSDRLHATSCPPQHTEKTEMSVTKRTQHLNY
jgi:hypothetical protein